MSLSHLINKKQI